MLENRLDFLSLENSLKLYESGVELDTRFHWVVCTEELPDNGYGMSSQEIISTHDEIYGEGMRDYLKIGDGCNEFDEFTLSLCPAPTYIDLIK